jgi:hypothetical protein
MKRWVIWTAVTLALCAVAVGVGSVFLSRASWRAATENGTFRDFREFTGKQLERDVRNRVPLGSSHEFVEGFLIGEEMKFRYDSKLNEIRADAECKGSFIITESLWLRFQFDGDSKLTSIDSKVILTGP